MTDGTSDDGSRSDRLRQRRSKRDRTAESAARSDSSSDDSGDSSEPSKPSEPSEPSKPSEPSEPSKPSEPSEPSKPSKLSIKEEQIGTYMYLPESQKKELERLYNVLKAEYEYEYDREFEKNRHFYPLVVDRGLDGLEEVDASDIHAHLQSR